MKTTKTRYLKDFAGPLEVWTSEDGTLLALAILPAEDSGEKLRSHWCFAKEQFDPSRIKKRYAHREFAGRDFFDGDGPTRRGAVWRITDEPSDFPVIEYQLLHPR